MAPSLLKINAMKKTFVFAGFLLLTFNHMLAQSKKVAVIVDERVELITTMQLLFDYPLVGKTDIKYKQELVDNFSRYQNDTSVLYFLNIAENNFGFNKPFNIGYHYTFPGFKQNIPFSDAENTQYEFGKHPEWKEPYADALKRFYAISGFHTFYKDHRSFYDSLIAGVATTVDSADVIGILENHYGVKQHSYTLVLSPLSIESGYSIWIKTKKGNDLYSIVGPNLESKITPDFDKRWIMQKLVIHEFSHPFCNPLIDKYYSLFEKDTCLFSPIKKALKQQGCGSWHNALSEFLTRANEIVLTEHIFCKDDADKVYNDYLNQGWIYIRDILPIIKKYEANRTQYKTLEDIMPEVIAYFDEEAKHCNL